MLAPVKTDTDLPIIFFLVYSELLFINLWKEYKNLWKDFRELIIIKKKCGKYTNISLMIEKKATDGIHRS